MIRTSPCSSFISCHDHLPPSFNAVFHTLFNASARQVRTFVAVATRSGNKSLSCRCRVLRCVLGLRRVVECSSTRTVDNYSSTISRTRIFGRKKKNPGHLALSRPTLTRARESGGRWHGTVGKNVSQLKHCQTHHSETGTNIWLKDF